MTDNLKEIAKQLGSRGGRASVESRFKGKSKSEISEMMRKVRTTKRDISSAQKIGKENIDSLNSVK